ncbi:MAG: hypothetical protein ACJ738_13750 [Gaiellales bacterium]
MLERSIERSDPVPDCPSCAQPVESRHRYCPWCAAPLRSKLVEFFAPHSLIESRARALRVSRYLGGNPDQRHTRLSIWDTDRAVSAISLGPAETRRLGRFLTEGAGGRPDDATTDTMPAVTGP